MSVAVLTSIYGGFDVPKVQPPQTVDAEWILVTDVPVDAPGWKVIVEPRPHMHPCLAAKIAKCLPRLYTDADVTVWMDGSCQLVVPDALEQIIAGSKGMPIAQVRHPDRDCIYDEAAFCVPIAKYADLPMIQQVETYRKAGHPEHWGLWATGLIVRNYVPPWGGEWKATNTLDRIGSEWLVEQIRWGFQDQLSEVPLITNLGMQTLPFPLHGSGLFEWHAGHH